jgi:hypothetical protein
MPAPIIFGMAILGGVAVGFAFLALEAGFPRNVARDRISQVCIGLLLVILALSGSALSVNAVLASLVLALGWW